MSFDEFNKDLDSYIKRRRRTDNFAYEPKEKIEEVEEHDYEEPMEEDYSDEESERIGFFARVRNFFGGEPEDLPEEEDMHFECREDMKLLGKITLSVVKSLSDDDLFEFKNSERYSELRGILSKYNLIRSEQK